jgi:hypothetical protein
MRGETCIHKSSEKATARIKNEFKIGSLTLVKVYRICGIDTTAFSDEIVGFVKDSEIEKTLRRVIL